MKKWRMDSRFRGNDARCEKVARFENDTGSENGMSEKTFVADRDYRVPAGCGVSGIMNEAGERFSGEAIITSIALMRDRSNGLGGGFAAYGIYPDLASYYAFHLMYETEDAKRQAEEYLKLSYTVMHDEPIPSREVKVITRSPILWRYFLKPRDEALVRNPLFSEEDLIAQTVMHINGQIRDALVASSGKNMGIFKGVGYPEDIGEFYCLENYRGYIWTAHGRFPTNSVAWWGGAHPFGLLDWSVVHNGEISSYGINRRYLQNFGYLCSFFTDTEVITYLVDLLSRKHGLSFEIVAKILAAPFWVDIERMPEEEKEFYEGLRMIYGSALLNGPFGVIVCNTETMLGLNDRLKLRPLVAARCGDFIYVASEESAIREICPRPDRVWMPRAGEPVIGRLKQEPGDRSQEPGDRSQEPGDRSQEPGDRSQESGVRSQEPGDRSQEPGVRSQESGVRRQESGVRSRENIPAADEDFGADQTLASQGQGLRAASQDDKADTQEVL